MLLLDERVECPAYAFALIHACVAMATIYLSSTYEDLKEHRRVVFDALRKSGNQVIAMEEYVATDQRPVDQCLKDVEKADIYIGLFAFRYGYIPPQQHNNPNGLSITELELRCAEALGKPCLTFVAKDTTPWSRAYDDAYASDDKGKRIKALRQHLLTEKLTSAFESPHELAALVLAAVTRVFEAPRQTKSLDSDDTPDLQKEETSESNFQKTKTHSEKIQGKDPVPTGSSRGLHWTTWLGRGLRIVAFVASLAIFLFAAWMVTQWGLTELNASSEAKPELLICQTLDGVGPEMIIVQPGSFQMGAANDKGFHDELPRHSVAIRAVAIGTCEVTFDDYDRFAQATSRSLPDDEGWGRGRRPVINVSWEDAIAYAAWLSQQTGKHYRLPTEAEWEYAARSGGKATEWAGTTDEKELADFAVYNAQRTEPVGVKKPSGLGLYDLSGNVWEWVEDCYHETYKGAPLDGSAWREAGEGGCSRRVLRGGSWLNLPENLRVSFRGEFNAVDRNFNFGFRLVQDIP